jgi:hypothetical protein
MFTGPAWHAAVAEGPARGSLLPGAKPGAALPTVAFRPRHIRNVALALTTPYAGHWRQPRLRSTRRAHGRSCPGGRAAWPQPALDGSLARGAEVSAGRCGHSNGQGRGDRVVQVVQACQCIGCSSPVRDELVPTLHLHWLALSPRCTAGRSTTVRRRCTTVSRWPRPSRPATHGQSQHTCPSTPQHVAHCRRPSSLALSQRPPPSAHRPHPVPFSGKNKWALTAR